VRGTPVEREWNVLVYADRQPSLALGALQEFLHGAGRKLMQEEDETAGRRGSAEIAEQ